MNNPVDFAPNLSAFKKEWLPLERAIQRVAKFEHDFGKAHLSLACHAALVSILTPELVNLIRINFLERSVEWIAESDLLLSSLCFPIHPGIYEIEPQIRQVLLVALQKDPAYGTEKLEEIASLLYFYNESPLANKLPRYIKRIYQWISSAYLDPDVAIQNMVNFLENTDLENSVSRIVNYQLAGKTLAMLANSLEMSNLQVELDDLVDSTYLIVQGYTGKADFSTLLQHNLSTLDETIQPLTSSVVDWFLSSEATANTEIVSVPLGLDSPISENELITKAVSINVLVYYTGTEIEQRSKLEDYVRRSLQQQGVISWHDCLVSPGVNWKQDIASYLTSAQIVLLLISSKFLESDFCYSVEMQRVLERHKAGKVRVIPILARPTDWTATVLQTLQVLPTNAKPITMWSNQDIAFAEVAAGIHEAIEDLLHSQTIPTTHNIQKRQAAIEPVELFYTYATQDEKWREALEKQLSVLQRHGIITGWHDGMTTPGTDKTQVVYEHLCKASIILLLVSPDFLVSNHLYEVLHLALERNRRGEAYVIPVILRPCVWKQTAFGDLKCLPANERPVTTWRNRDKAFLDIEQGIREVIEQLTASAHDTSSSTRNTASTPLPATPSTTYKGHTHFVFTVAWSPDSKYVASAGADETVRVWNATTLETIQTYSARVGWFYPCTGYLGHPFQKLAPRDGEGFPSLVCKHRRVGVE